eukprot:m51a1_g3150 hypothetical protein (878) ;mRNA; r:324963-327890
MQASDPVDALYERLTLRALEWYSRRPQVLLRGGDVSLRAERLQRDVIDPFVAAHPSAVRDDDPRRWTETSWKRKTLTAYVQYLSSRGHVTLSEGATVIAKIHLKVREPEQRVQRRAPSADHSRAYQDVVVVEDRDQPAAPRKSAPCPAPSSSAALRDDEQQRHAPAPAPEPRPKEAERVPTDAQSEPRRAAQCSEDGREERPRARAPEPARQPAEAIPHVAPSHAHQERHRTSAPEGAQQPAEARKEASRSDQPAAPAAQREEAPRMPAAPDASTREKVAPPLPKAPQAQEHAQQQHQQHQQQPHRTKVVTLSLAKRDPASGSTSVPPPAGDTRAEAARGHSAPSHAEDSGKPVPRPEAAPARTEAKEPAAPAVRAQQRVPGACASAVDARSAETARAERGATSVAAPGAGARPPSAPQQARQEQQQAPRAERAAERYNTAAALDLAETPKKAATRPHCARAEAEQAEERQGIAKPDSAALKAAIASGTVTRRYLKTPRRVGTASRSGDVSSPIPLHGDLLRRLSDVDSDEMRKLREENERLQSRVNDLEVSHEQRKRPAGELLAAFDCLVKKARVMTRAYGGKTDSRLCSQRDLDWACESYDHLACAIRCIITELLPDNPILHAPPPPVADRSQVTLVVDTNVFVHELPALFDVVKMPRVSIVVPLQVQRELDVLKERVKTEQAAREAIHYLGIWLREPGMHVSMQRIGEALNLSGEARPASPDENIINCALYLRTVAAVNVQMISDDRNLLLRAESNGLEAMRLCQFLKKRGMQPQAQFNVGCQSSAASDACDRRPLHIVRNHKQAQHQHQQFQQFQQCQQPIPQIQRSQNQRQQQYCSQPFNFAAPGATQTPEWQRGQMGPVQFVQAPTQVGVK